MPINYEELFAPTVKVGGDEASNRAAFLAAGLRYKNQPQYDDKSEIDLITQTKNDLLMSGDEQQFVRDELINNANAQVDSLLNQLIAQSSESPGLIPAVAEHVKAVDTQIRTVPESPYSDLVRAAVTDLSRSGPDNIRNEEIYFAKLVGDIAARALEKRGLFDKVSDFGFMVINPDQIKDKFDMSGTLDPSGAFVDELKELKALPALERAAKLPEFVGRLEKAFDGNEWKWVPELIRLIEEPEEESLIDDAAYDIMSAASFPFASKAVIAMSRLARATSNIKLLNALDPELAGKMVAATLSNPTEEMMKISGLTQQQAALSALGNPQLKVLDNAIVTGAAPEAINAVRAETAKINAILAGLLDDIVKRQETALTDTQRGEASANAIKRLEETISKLKDPWGGNYTIKSWTTTGSSPTGFTARVELTNSGGWETNRVFEVPFTRKDTGTFAGKVEVGGLRAFMGSPDTFLEKMTKGWVSKFSRLLGEQAKTLGIMAKARTEVTKGLTSKEAKELDVLYDAGRKGGVVFEHGQLKGGDNPLRKPLSDKMIAAYYKGRQLEEWTHTFANYAARRSLEFDGFKGVKALVTNDKGLKVEQTIIARPEKLPGDVHLVWDSTTGKALTRLEVEKAMKLDPGLQVAFVRGGLKQGGKEYSHTLTHFNKVGDLPIGVLAKPKNGYITMIPEKANYVGFKSIKTTKGGRTGTTWEVSHVFDTQKDAEGWLKAQTQTADNQYTLVRSDEAASHPDYKQAYRAMLSDSPFNAYGGLARGRESTTPIYYTSENLEREFLAPLQALDAQLGFIARNLPINEMKMTAIQEFKNTAGKHLADPKDWTSEITLAGRRGAALKAAQGYLKDLVGIPTKGELKFHSFSLNLAEALEKMVNKGVPAAKSIRNGVLKAGRTDPIGAIRNATFHSLLGSFNPSQFFVQMQGAVAALTLDPLKAPQFMGQYAAMRFALYEGEHFSPGTWKRLASFAGMKPDELRGLVKQFKDSGLPDTVRSNSDYEVAKIGGLVDAGSWKRIVESSTMFFREGELVSRGYSYLFARDAFVTKNKRLPTTTKDLREVYDETLRLTLNMTAANKAVWQKGILSIPTQFMQITAKFLENFVLPETLGGTGAFTTAQKMMVLLGSFGLYGTAGVPFGKAIKDNVADYMGVKPGELSPEVSAAINGGLWELGLYLALGEPVDVSNRFAMASGLQAFFEAYDSGQEDTFKKMLAGASGSLPPRMLEAFQDLAPRVWTFTDPELDTSAEDVLIALSELTDITSSGRNAKQALRWAIEGRISNNAGQTLVELDDDERFKTALVKAFGFQPQEISQYYDTTRFLKMEEEDLNDSAQQLFRWYGNMFVQISAAGSKEEIDRLTKSFRVGTGAIVFGLGEQERLEVWKRFNTKVGKADSKFKEVMLKAMEHYMTFGELPPGTVTNVRLSESVEATKENE